jgi:tagatose-1,6-bisphosphate aldolase
MGDETTKRTEALIDRLRERRQESAADRLSRTLVHGAESGLLFALRETLETLLTGVEAIDPVTQTMMEELRLEVEKRLGPPGGTARSPGG